MRAAPTEVLFMKLRMVKARGPAFLRHDPRAAWERAWLCNVNNSLMAGKASLCRGVLGP